MAEKNRGAYEFNIEDELLVVVDALLLSVLQAGRRHYTWYPFMRSNFDCRKTFCGMGCYIKRA